MDNARIVLIAIVCLWSMSVVLAVRCKATHETHKDGCCTKTTPCAYGDGDCDGHADCMKGLKCSANSCARTGLTGWHPDADCCSLATDKRECAAALNNKGKWDGCCTKASPCGYMDGDCDSDAECATGLVCGMDNCGKGFHKSADCCIPAPRCHAAMKKNIWNGCCTKDNPCDVGDGDCDSDAECVGKLKCGLNNCGNELHKLADCCYMPDSAWNTTI